MDLGRCSILRCCDALIGFGPIGIYRCFSGLSASDMVRTAEIPRFLGFQQAANCPMVAIAIATMRRITILRFVLFNLLV